MEEVGSLTISFPYYEKEWVLYQNCLASKAWVEK